MKWIEELDDLLATVEDTAKGSEGDMITKARGLIQEHRLEAGQQETIVIGLPPLKEMEGEILEALENLDIIVHADEPMIGNRFATASAIYKVFKNKIDQ